MNTGKESYVIPSVVVAVGMCIATWLLAGHRPQVKEQGNAGSPGCSEVVPHGIALHAVRLGGEDSTRLLVSVVNESDRLIHLQYYMQDLDDDDNSPLQARVVEVPSGRLLGRRLLRTTARTRGWCEAEFVGAVPGCAYGTALDLSHYFALTRGRRYQVVFTYSTKAPTVVGRIKPWRGVLHSRPVMIRAS